MYLKRLQLANYGPLQDLDISLPFDGACPKPVLLVGENGSGKTIALSHIVNAIVQARDAAYQESSELDAGKSSNCAAPPTSRSVPITTTPELISSPGFSYANSA